LRLDKYLKITRIIKRRTVANDACDSSLVTVNGRPAKASYEVKIGDLIEIAYGTRSTRFKVLSISEHSTKATAAEMYEIIV